MDDFSKLITNFCGAVALIMALVLLVSIVRRGEHHKRNNTLLMGVLFSVAVLYTMVDPIHLEGGRIFDMRGLLVGTATALFGPLVGLMALLTGSVMRIIVDGPGVTSGLVGITAVFVVGLLWRYFIRPINIESWMKTCALGLLLNVQLLGVFAAPPHLWYSLALTVGPYMAVANLLGVFIMSHLMAGELLFISKAECLKIAANTDHLTGLLNRRGLDVVVRKLKVELPKNKGRALICFDIDNFKEANDTHGHAVGDDVLKHVVDRVSDSLRRNDIFARMGGDEFAVILPEVGVKEARVIAERCRVVVAEEEFLDGAISLPITISVGAIWLHQPDRIEEMAEAADKALYEAKENGRNAVVFLSSLRAKKERPASVLHTVALCDETRVC